MKSSARPNLFVVGSMKSGTSSLHAYLQSHPSVFMTTDPKEPTYFLEREQLLDVLPGVERRGFWRGEQFYLELFKDAGDAPVIGEASANYSRLNRVQRVPERIASFNPDARIVLIMRDPVERTISHYWYMVRFFRERRDMLTAVQQDPDYCETSYYAMQLRPYLNLFGAKNVKALTMEALQNRPRETMADLFAWLGVDDTFVPSNLGDRVNETPSVIAQARGAGLLQRFRRASPGKWVGPLVPAKIRSFARRFAEREVERNDVDTVSVKRYLRALQAEQTEELKELLARDFSEWTSLYDAE